LLESQKCYFQEEVDTIIDETEKSFYKQLDVLNEMKLQLEDSFEDVSFHSFYSVINFQYLQKLSNMKESYEKLQESLQQYQQRYSVPTIFREEHHSSSSFFSSSLVNYSNDLIRLKQMSLLLRKRKFQESKIINSLLLENAFLSLVKTIVVTSPMKKMNSIVSMTNLTTSATTTTPRNKNSTENNNLSILRYELLYSGSLDGFSLEKFHELCDYQGSTIVLFKCLSVADDENPENMSAKGPFIFGGYSSVSWSNPENPQYVTDYNLSSCLFSFIHPYSTVSQQLSSVTPTSSSNFDITPIIFPLKEDRMNEAIVIGKDFGPTFGAGNDMMVSSDMKSVSFAFNSYDSAGLTLGDQSLMDTLEIKELIFTGNLSNEITEIEIWKV
jgi:hypothetical protein